MSVEFLKEAREFLEKQFQKIDAYEKTLEQALESYNQTTPQGNQKSLILKGEEVEPSRLIKILYYLHYRKKELEECRKIINNPKPWHDLEIKKAIPVVIEIMDGLDIPCSENLPKNP